MNLNITKASATTRKIRIEQNVPSGSVRKGPYAIERSVNPSEVVIKRRFGEGSKPLFQRDDIVVNPDNVVSKGGAHCETQPKDRSNNSAEEDGNQWRKERYKSTESSSPERFCKHHPSKINENSSSGNHITTRHTKTLQPSKENLNTASKHRDSSPPTNRHHRTSEKVPYFIDEVRERDRIRRKYGKRSTKSPSPRLSSKFRGRRSSSRPISRSRSHSAGRSKNRTHAYGSHSRRSSSVDRYMSGSRNRRRENLRTERGRAGQYRHYGHRSEEQERSRRGRSPRSRTRSRTRSRERSRRDRARSDERHKNPHGNHDETTNAELNQRKLTQPQIITIPVPVPADFMNYAYSAWPTQAQWSHPMPPPTRYGAPAYHMPTILPATVMPPMRPTLPPYGLPPQPMRYGGRGLRFPHQYGPRPWRPNFRPKTHK